MICVYLERTYIYWVYFYLFSYINNAIISNRVYATLTVNIEAWFLMVTVMTLEKKNEEEYILKKYINNNLLMYF